jgi:hypothetical protein
MSNKLEKGKKILEISTEIFALIIGGINVFELIKNACNKEG